MSRTHLTKGAGTSRALCVLREWRRRDRQGADPFDHFESAVPVTGEPPGPLAYARGTAIGSFMAEAMGESRELRCAVPENQFFEKIFTLVSSNIRAWQAIGAAIALVGSIVAAGLGTVLSGLGWLLAGQGFGPLLDQIETIAFFLTIPVLIIAAHCLDLLERKSKSSAIPVAGAGKQAEVSKSFDPSSYLPGRDLPVAALPARRPPDFTD